MSVRTHDPFESVSVPRELERLMGLTRPLRGEEAGVVHAADWVPPVDIEEDDKGFTILADVPGVSAQEIEITMDKGVLTIKGHRPPASEEERQRQRRAERQRGTFLRRFTLPDTADAEKIAARTDAGVLVVTIPKAVKAQPRKITVAG